MTDPTETALAKRTPETSLDHAEEWAALTAEARKQKTALALRDNDREALWALTRSHLMTFGRKGLRVSPNTLDSYRRGQAQLLDWCGAHAVKAHQLGAQEARRFATSLEGEGRSPATINARLAACRAFVAALGWSGMMTGDPFAKLGRTDPTPAHEKREAYSVEELDQLLAVADDRERVIVLLAADAGLRVSELRAVEWSEVDLPGKRLVVRSGKGGKKRTVALTGRTVEALEALGVGAGPVIGVNRQRIYAIVDALCRRAGVASRGVHSLRHSCGTRLYRATKDLLVVGRHLGHSTTRPTEVYAKLNADDYAAAVDLLGEAKRAAA